jgi:hypothetical protein
MVFGKNRPIDLNKDLSPEEISDCLSMEVTISTPGLIEDLLKQSDLNFPASPIDCSIAVACSSFF